MRPSGDRPADLRASMEPRSAERGNRCERFEDGLYLLASMEPRSAERGNFAWAHSSGRIQTASMEPRSAERGNFLDRHEDQTGVSGLQWSHAQPNVETSARPLPLTCNTSASMEPRSAERGNKVNYVIRVKAKTASMEPRSAERGNCGIGGHAASTLALQWSHAQPNVETIRCIR